MSPISIPGKVTLARPDSDVANYIAAVETADGQSLEFDVKFAYNNFIVGCKSDGIWDAIKASCILAGARTLAGALVPLKGTAPTNFNFVSGDYNRETGLVGDGSTKYLDSNRKDNDDPQNSAHAFTHVSTADSRFASLTTIGYVGTTNTGATSSRVTAPYNNGFYTGNRSNAGLVSGVAANSIGGIGTSRSSSTAYSIRVAGSSFTRTVTSVAPGSQAVLVFADNAGGAVAHRTNARLSFYSIGESLDLALLDARVTTLMSDIGAAIP